MSKPEQLISIIVPAHNEAHNLGWFGQELLENIVRLCPAFNFEYIFIDDGSSDDTLAVIKRFAKQYENVRYISFSRNFGKEAATSAGLRIARGDAAIMIDADGQHPYEMLPKFIDKWQAGADVVIGVRSSNQKEGWIKKYGSKLFYWLLSKLSEAEAIPAATDFRLIDRRVLDEFNRLTEHNRITRGLLDWLGFNKDFLEFDAPARKFGKATYSHAKLLRLALNSFVAHSTKPLKLIGVLGLLVTFLSAAVGIFVLIEEWLLNDPMHLSITGTALLAVFLSFLTGLTLSSLGLLALYVETIHSETQNRPLYIINETNLKNQSE